MRSKVEWAKKREPGPPCAVTVPGPLIEVSFMVKDSKRFPGTNGWGYATFRHDAASATWRPLGDRLRGTASGENVSAAEHVKDPLANDSSKHASNITLVDVTKGEAFPCAPAGSVVSSSVSLGWRGIIVERHRLEPQELPQHYVVGHGISVSTSKRPIPFGWRGRCGWLEGVLNPSDFHLLTDGEFNTPRWLHTFDQVSLVLEPRFVADLVGESLPADRVAFMTQRSLSDPTIARYTDAFLSEIVADSPNGPLYAETLTVGFALHLLSHYAVAKPKVPLPRGRLNSFQLRTVVDFIQSNLSENLSLVAMAGQAHVSPFHFARQFRATVGMSPHQFVLRQRIQKSLRLIKARQLSLAQVAVESGFHDQPHFTRAFHRYVGITPGRYLARP